MQASTFASYFWSTPAPEPVPAPPTADSVSEAPAPANVEVSREYPATFPRTEGGRRNFARDRKLTNIERRRSRLGTTKYISSFSLSASDLRDTVIAGWLIYTPVQNKKRGASERCFFAIRAGSMQKFISETQFKANSDEPLMSFPLENASFQFNNQQELQISQLQDFSMFHLFANPTDLAPNETRYDLEEWRDAVEDSAYKFGGAQKYRMELDVAAMRKALAQLCDMCANVIPPNVQKRINVLTLEISAKDEFLGDIAQRQEELKNSTQLKKPYKSKSDLLGINENSPEGTEITSDNLYSSGYFMPREESANDEETNLEGSANDVASETPVESMNAIEQPRILKIESASLEGGFSLFKSEANLIAPDTPEIRKNSKQFRFSALQSKLTANCSVQPVVAPNTLDTEDKSPQETDDDLIGFTEEEEEKMEMLIPKRKFTINLEKIKNNSSKVTPAQIRQPIIAKPVVAPVFAVQTLKNTIPEPVKSAGTSITSKFLDEPNHSDKIAALAKQRSAAELATIDSQKLASTLVVTPSPQPITLKTSKSTSFQDMKIDRLVPSHVTYVHDKIEVTVTESASLKKSTSDLYSVGNKPLTNLTRDMSSESTAFFSYQSLGTTEVEEDQSKIEHADENIEISIFDALSGPLNEEPRFAKTVLSADRIRSESNVPAIDAIKHQKNPSIISKIINLSRTRASLEKIDTTDSPQSPKVPSSPARIDSPITPTLMRSFTLKSDVGSLSMDLGKIFKRKGGSDFNLTENKTASNSSLVSSPLKSSNALLFSVDGGPPPSNIKNNQVSEADMAFNNSTSAINHQGNLKSTQEEEDSAGIGLAVNNQDDKMANEMKISLAARKLNRELREQRDSETESDKKIAATQSKLVPPALAPRRVQVTELNSALLSERSAFNVSFDQGGSDLNFSEIQAVSSGGQFKSPPDFSQALAAPLTEPDSISAKTRQDSEVNMPPLYSTINIQSNLKYMKGEEDSADRGLAGSNQDDKMANEMKISLAARKLNRELREQRDLETESDKQLAENRGKLAPPLLPPRSLLVTELNSAMLSQRNVFEIIPDMKEDLAGRSAEDLRPKIFKADILLEVKAKGKLQIDEDANQLLVQEEIQTFSEQAAAAKQKAQNLLEEKAAVVKLANELRIQEYARKNFEAEQVLEQEAAARQLSELIRAEAHKLIDAQKLLEQAAIAKQANDQLLMEKSAAIKLATDLRIQEAARKMIEAEKLLEQEEALAKERLRLQKLANELVVREDALKLIESQKLSDKAETAKQKAQNSLDEKAAVIKLANELRIQETAIKAEKLLELEAAAKKLAEEDFRLQKIADDLFVLQEAQKLVESQKLLEKEAIFKLKAQKQADEKAAVSKSAMDLRIQEAARSILDGEKKLEQESATNKLAEEQLRLQKSANELKSRQQAQKLPDSQILTAKAPFAKQKADKFFEEKAAGIKLPDDPIPDNSSSQIAPQLTVGQSKRISQAPVLKANQKISLPEAAKLAAPQFLKPVSSIVKGSAQQINSIEASNISKQNNPAPGLKNIDAKVIKGSLENAAKVPAAPIIRSFKEISDGTNVVESLSRSTSGFPQAPKLPTSSSKASLTNSIPRMDSLAVDSSQLSGALLNSVDSLSKSASGNFKQGLGPAPKLPTSSSKASLTNLMSAVDASPSSGALVNAVGTLSKSASGNLKQGLAPAPKLPTSLSKASLTNSNSKADLHPAEVPDVSPLSGANVVESITKPSNSNVKYGFLQSPQISKTFTKSDLTNSNSKIDKFSQELSKPSKPEITDLIKGPIMTTSIDAKTNVSAFQGSVAGPLLDVVSSQLRGGAFSAAESLSKSTPGNLKQGFAPAQKLKTSSSTSLTNSKFDIIPSEAAAVHQLSGSKVNIVESLMKSASGNLKTGITQNSQVVSSLSKSSMANSSSNLLPLEASKPDTSIPTKAQVIASKFELKAKSNDVQSGNLSNSTEPEVLSPANLKSTKLSSKPDFPVETNSTISTKSLPIPSVPLATPILGKLNIAKISLVGPSSSRPPPSAAPLLTTANFNSVKLATNEIGVSNAKNETTVAPPLLNVAPKLGNINIAKPTSSGVRKSIPPPSAAPILKQSLPSTSVAPVLKNADELSKTAISGKVPPPSAAPILKNTDDASKAASQGKAPQLLNVAPKLAAVLKAPVLKNP